MKLGCAVSAAALLAVTGAGAARSQDESFLTRWSYTLSGGGMFPASQEGRELKRGPFGAAALDYEVNESLLLGLDLGFNRSHDPFETRILMGGGHGRLSPAPELPLYVQGGIAIYGVTYDASGPGVPPGRVRPGLSFGIGTDVATLSRIVIGVAGTYHGVIMARSDALSFLTLGISVSLRPAPL